MQQKSWIVFVSSLVMLVSKVFLIRAIAAPENFNPQLATPPPEEIDVELSSSQVDKPVKPSEQEQSDANDETAKPKPDKVKTAAQTPLPTPTLPRESSLSSGTAEIELKPPPDADKSSNPSKLAITNIDLNFQLDFDNFGQTNLLTEQIIAFNLDDLSFVLNTGINFFEQDDIEEVSNTPLYLTWETKLKNIDLSITGGADLFNRLAAVPTVTLKASSPLFSSVTDDGELRSLFVLSGQAQYQAYKFNAETLENQIKFWRFTPSIYWQIRPNLSLFTMGQFGIFNDDNREFQSFSRLEQKIGSFSVAANLFTWDFQEDLGSENGYFSPSDFLVYNAELGWNGTMFDESLDCKLSVAFGKQSVDRVTDNAWTYKALCGAQLLSNVKLDFGYTLSNIRDSETQETNFTNQSFSGQLYFEF